MTTIANRTEQSTFTITEEIHVRASLEATFEFWGPLFMSTGSTNNLIYRLSEKDGGTLITFKHTLVGPVPDDFRDNMPPGWAAMHARVKRHAETRKH